AERGERRRAHRLRQNLFAAACRIAPWCRERTAATAGTENTSCGCGRFVMPRVGACRFVEAYRAARRIVQGGSEVFLPEGVVFVEILASFRSGFERFGLVFDSEPVGNRGTQRFPT